METGATSYSPDPDPIRKHARKLLRPEFSYKVCPLSQKLNPGARQIKQSGWLLTLKHSFLKRTFRSKSAERIEKGTNDRRLEVVRNSGSWLAAPLHTRFIPDERPCITTSTTIEIVVQTLLETLAEAPSRIHIHLTGVRHQAVNKPGRRAVDPHSSHARTALECSDALRKRLPM